MPDSLLRCLLAAIALWCLAAYPPWARAQDMAAAEEEDDALLEDQSTPGVAVRAAEADGPKGSAHADDVDPQAAEQDSAEPRTTAELLGRDVFWREDTQAVDSRSQPVDVQLLMLPSKVEKVDGERLWLMRAWVEADKVMTADDAFTYYTRAINLNPRNARAYIYRGALRRSKGDFDRAIRDYDEAIANDPSLAMAWRYRGDAWRSKDEPRRAIGDYNEALLLDPTYAAAYAGRAHAWYLLDDPQQSIADYSEAIRLDPGNPLWWSSRGDRWYELEEYQKAADDFVKAVELDPYHMSAHFWLAMCYDEIDDPDGAIRHYTAVIDMGGRYMAAHYNRGLKYYRRGDYDQAMQDFDEALTIVPREFIYHARGVIWEKRGHWDNAIEQYTKAIEFHSDYALAYLARGRLLQWQMKTPQAAIADFSEVIRIEPENFTAWYRRAMAWKSQRKRVQAMDDLSEAIRLKPDHAPSLYARAQLYTLEHQPQKAIADLDALVRSKPEMQLAFTARGNVWLSLGETQKAIDDYSSAMRVGQTPLCRSKLAWILSTSEEAEFRNGSRAVELAKEACELANWRGGNYLATLAAAYAENGQFDEAIATQQRAIEQASRPQAGPFRARLSLYQQGKPYCEPAGGKQQQSKKQQQNRGNKATAE